MGISTYQSYCGAQIFDAVGLAERIRREILHRHRDNDRGRRPRGHCRRSAGAACPRFRRRPALSRHARSGRRLRVPSAWRGACLDTAIGRQIAARGARQFGGRLQGLRADDQRPERAASDNPRLDEVQTRRSADPARRSRARRRYRATLRHRGDELRLDQPRGAHDLGDRDEPHRRQIEHRRGRRGSISLQAAAERRLDALGDQAGRLRPVRRHDRIPGQRRCLADQDGAGREARRGRTIARPQGRQDDRASAATRPPASALFHRRRTTTSIRSRIWRS